MRRLNEINSLFYKLQLWSLLLSFFVKYFSISFKTNPKDYLAEAACVGGGGCPTTGKLGGSPAHWKTRGKSRPLENLGAKEERAGTF